MSIIGNIRIEQQITELLKQGLSIDMIMEKIICEYKLNSQEVIELKEMIYKIKASIIFELVTEKEKDKKHIESINENLFQEIGGCVDDVYNEYMCECELYLGDDWFDRDNCIEEVMMFLENNPVVKHQNMMEYIKKCAWHFIEEQYYNKSIEEEISL